MSDILFTNAVVPDRLFGSVRKACVGVTGSVIDYVGDYKPGSSREIDCRNGFLMPAFCNSHAHSAMTLLRGIGEDLPLDKWLNDVIFPAEAGLTPEMIYTGTLYACAEMMKYGTASCIDMYFRSLEAAAAYDEAGIRATVTPVIFGFGDSRFSDLEVFGEYKELIAYCSESRFAEAGVGLHSEYITTERVCREAAEYAAENGLCMHIHVSETLKETDECKARHGMTPAAYLDSCGVFRVRTTAAHCIWLTDDDREIFRKRGVTVASCPQSNLKLGSGVCDYASLSANGIRLALGTDGAASNNNLNMLKEARLAALLTKGLTHDASAFPAGAALYAASAQGAMSRGDGSYGSVEIGMKADLALFDFGEVNMSPCGDEITTLLYSADGEASLTMCDGRIVYADGEYYTIDIEKTKADLIRSRRILCGK